MGGPTQEPADDRGRWSLQGGNGSPAVRTSIDGAMRTSPATPATSGRASGGNRPCPPRAIDGGEPENALSGQISWRSNTHVDRGARATRPHAVLAEHRVAALSPSGRVTLTNGTLGYEWNPEYPAVRELVSARTGPALQHHDRVGAAPPEPVPRPERCTRLRRRNGAVVVGPRRRTTTEGTAPRIATCNRRRESPRRHGGAARDAPVRARRRIRLDRHHHAERRDHVLRASVTGPGTRTVSGTAADAGGGVVGAVEVSTDGGSTWRRATGRESWSYTFTAPAGTPAIRVRAADDSANLGSPVALGAPVTACPAGLTCSSIFAQSVTGAQDADGIGGRAGSEVPLRRPGSDRRRPLLQDQRQHRRPHRDPVVGDRPAPGDRTFAAESATGWQEAAFSAPVDRSADTTYIASYHTNTGNYATGTSFASAGVDTPPLHALVRVSTGRTASTRTGPAGCSRRTRGVRELPRRRPLHVHRTAGRDGARHHRNDTCGGRRRREPRCGHHRHVQRGDRPGYVQHVDVPA